MVELVDLLFFFFFFSNQYHQPKKSIKAFTFHIPVSHLVFSNTLNTLKCVSLYISSDCFIEVAPIGVLTPSAVTSLTANLCLFEWFVIPNYSSYVTGFR